MFFYSLVSPRLQESFKTSCPQDPMPYTPARLHLARISALTELLLCVNTGAPLSPRALTAVAEHCQQWARGKVRALPSPFLPPHCTT